jgi:PAS domain S-box-containing protein
MERPSSKGDRTDQLVSALLDCCPAPIYAKDLQGGYVLVNREWEAIFHVNRSEALGRTDDALFPPVLAEAARARDRKAVETGAPVKSVQEVEREDGRHTYASVKFPVRNAAGDVCAVGGICWESVAGAHEDYYRALVENAMEIMSIITAGGKIRYASPAVRNVLGYEPEALAGRSMFELVHPKDRKAARAALARGLRTPESAIAIELRLRHSDGSWRILDCTGRNLVADPAIGGFIVNSRDITARKQAESALGEREAALKRTSEQMRALAARLLRAEEEGRQILSRELHDDLNQRLAVLAFEAESLARDVPPSCEPIRGELMRLHRRLAEASEDVRVLAHHLRPSILDDLGLAPALRSHCAEFSRRESINVRFSAQDMPAAVPPEAALCLYRVAQEALRNVAKHSHAREASVMLTAAGGAVELSIKDSGSGFDPGSAGTGGLGILSMAERARLAGGTLEVVSRPGAGTEVRVRVPAGEAVP